jgi:nuclear pore complex protein Nup205
MAPLRLCLNADDLNPLYVYEAKMSLFTRMTQSRAGAECLLEAHILSVLTKCDFLDARPESDQTFIRTRPS